MGTRVKTRRRREGTLSFSVCVSLLAAPPLLLCFSKIATLVCVALCRYAQNRVGRFVFLSVSTKVPSWNL